MVSFELKFNEVETPLSLGSLKKLDILGVEKTEKISLKSFLALTL